MNMVPHMRARASVLWNLRHGGAMSQRALATAIGVSPRNVTGLVDALEADGFVATVDHLLARLRQEDC